MSADERYEKKTIEVLGKRMAYVDVGSGDPIVFPPRQPDGSGRDRVHGEHRSTHDLGYLAAARP